MKVKGFTESMRCTLQNTTSDGASTQRCNSPDTHLSSAKPPGQFDTIDTKRLLAKVAYKVVFELLLPHWLASAVVFSCYAQRVDALIYDSIA
eukprot:2458056-Amphidinium_carterae.1